MRHYSSEELQGKLEAFPEVFKMKTGDELDLNQVKAYLEAELTRKKTKLIEEAFSEMSIHAIRDLISEINERQKPPVKELLKSKGKKK